MHDGDKFQTGHYRAIRRLDGSWFELNDEAVNEISKQKVIKQETYILLCDKTLDKQQLGGVTQMIVNESLASTSLESTLQSL